MVVAPESSELQQPIASRSWQSRVVDLLVRARMRPHAMRPIDPVWVRAQMGRPKAPRRWMVQAAGCVVESLPAHGLWPGGDRVQRLSDSRVGDERTHGAVGASTDPVLLYLHGGGYIACSPETHRPLVASLVRRIGGSGYVPTYRLAPEDPYPAALDDARNAYRYLLDTLGIASSRIVLVGDSAGGGLALALTLSLRDDGLPMPSSVVVFSPWTDLAVTGLSLDENSERCAMFAGETIRRAAKFYLGGADPRLPYISPLYGDFHGFPPMLVHASTDEVLRDDSIRVVQRARADGAHVEFRMWSGVPHVWQFFPAVLPEAAASLYDVERFVARHLP